MKRLDRCFCNVPKHLTDCCPYIKDDVLRLFVLDSKKVRNIIILYFLVIALLIAVLAQKAHFYVYPIVDYQLLALFLVIILLLIVQFYFIISGYMVFQASGIFEAITAESEDPIPDEKQACLDTLYESVEALCKRIGLKVSKVDA